MNSYRTFFTVTTILFGLFLSSRLLPVEATPTQAVIDQIVVLNNQGVALMEQLKFEEAAAEFERMTTLDSVFAPAFVNLGIARFYQQNNEEAARALTQALKLDAGQIRAHYVLGLIYRNQAEAERALGEFLKVAELAPEDASTNYFIGLLYSLQKDYEKAVRYLQKAVARQAYNASAYYNLAQAQVRGGHREEGQQALAIFQRLQGQFGTDTVGLQYLEQGPFALVIDNLSPYLPVSEQQEVGNPVTFTEVGAEAGLKFSASAGRDRDQKSANDQVGKTIAHLGSGVAFADYNGDGLLDLFVADASGSGSQGGLYRNTGNGKFEESTKRAGISSSGRTMAALWGDVNNDKLPDLYLINYGPNQLFLNNGDLTFRDVTSSAGVGDPSWGLGGTMVDYDHDGDVDIVVANFSDGSRPQPARNFPEGFKGAPNVLYRNNGNGTFTDVAAAAGVAGGASRTVSVVAHDFDNSRDVDLLFMNLGTGPQLFSNRRDGTFELKNLPGPQRSVIGMGVGDFNQDTWMDIVFTGAAGPSTLLTNRGNDRFESSSLDGLLSGYGSAIFHAAQFFDFDNDGDLDLALVAGSLFSPNRQSAGQGRLVLLENRHGKFNDVSRTAGLEGLPPLPLRGLSITDYDNDGDLDMAVGVNGAAPLLLRNDGGNRNSWVQFELEGTNSNSAGLNTKVEILAGRSLQKVEVSGGAGVLSQSPPLVHFGLGKKKQIDAVRLLWPGGVLQSEVGKPVNKRLKLQELDRKGTSCPLLYVWNGRNYQFQTDFLGGSAFGYLLKPGTYNYPDTDEYIKLNREQLELKEGKLALTLNNQLEEVIYFDRLELLAVDHPPDYEVFADEKLLPGPPYDEFRVLTTQDLRPPPAAFDGDGNDILAEISWIDRTYPDAFALLPFKGYAEPHEIVLDLGSVSREHAQLILHAWIDYADSSANLAASQAGVALVPPYLQVQDKQGNWITAIERMGFPAGLPKTMTVDLSGKFVSESTKVRIVTSMRIYWDQILVDSSSPRTDYVMTRLAPVGADLHFRGFPAFESPDGREPKVYDYTRISPTAQWKVHAGGYTRYGDVSPLLAQRDDRYVITRSGDEIEAQFDVSGLPALKTGWIRDYFVYVDGFGKDMDVNSAFPDSVGPLPFHSMESYPYPEDPALLRRPGFQEYLKEWNTRTEEGWLPGRSLFPGVNQDPLIP